jgi:hypothetical protein
MKNFKYTELITRTIYIYYVERAMEFRHLLYDYKRCIDLSKRRTMRKRKQELIAILNNAECINKGKLMPILGMKYTDIKNYPQLIEIKRKEEYLKRAIS